ncbi:MAG: cytidine deaminase [Deltaproteobacteria bacterium]|nr:cytidine deaminase [Deltaproteobacteria bacterium]
MAKGASRQGSQGREDGFRAKDAKGRKGRQREEGRSGETRKTKNEKRPRPWSRLLAAARRARARAYAPYSRFAVGAALLADDGTIFAGANVENASFGLTICAERSAVVAAVSAGKRRFLALALVAGRGAPASPCGACRQVLHEFAPDLPIRMASADGRTRDVRLTELLPLGFAHEDLIGRR